MTRSKAGTQAASRIECGILGLLDNIILTLIFLISFFLFIGEGCML
jgi:hypothetical protein